MISNVDKAILGTVGVLLTGMTGAASTFAWNMMHASSGIAGGAPGAVVAELALADGSVKTRHRETLAWTDGRLRQELREGDRIRTLSGAHASVHYAQGLEVELDPDSQITVHGPVDAKGETLIAAIDVVDGSIRAKVDAGKALALRDAAGRDQGQVRSSNSGGSAEVSLKAPEQADGSIGLKVLPGSTVSVKGTEGEAKTLTEGQEQRLGEIVPTTPTPPPTPVATAVPPLEPGAPLPAISFDSGDIHIHRALPPGVKSVEVRGKAAVVKDGNFDIELFNQPTGVTTIDLVYIHTDGRVTRQPQRIRVGQ